MNRARKLHVHEGVRQPLQSRAGVPGGHRVEGLRLLFNPQLDAELRELRLPVSQSAR